MGSRFWLGASIFSTFGQHIGELAGIAYAFWVFLRMGDYGSRQLIDQ